MSRWNLIHILMNSSSCLACGTYKQTKVLEEIVKSQREKNHNKELMNAMTFVFSIISALSSDILENKFQQRSASI